MAVLRAVENGFALARSARNGLLTLSDNRGRILAESETVPDRFVSITGKVNVSREQTFYARTGDWFAWLCVTVFVSLLAFQRLAASHAGEKRHRVVGLPATSVRARQQFSQNADRHAASPNKGVI